MDNWRLGEGQVLSRLLDALVAPRTRRQRRQPPGRCWPCQGTGRLDDGHGRYVAFGERITVLRPLLCPRCGGTGIVARR